MDLQFDAAAFEKFLVDSIKVEGKTGQLGEDVKITREGSGQLAVVSSIPFSKRYLKYLTKKFLKVRGSPCLLENQYLPTLYPVCRRTSCASGSVSSRPLRTPTPSASTTSPSTRPLTCVLSLALLVPPTDSPSPNRTSKSFLRGATLVDVMGSGGEYTITLCRTMPFVPGCSVACLQDSCYAMYPPPCFPLAFKRETSRVQDAVRPRERFAFTSSVLSL